MTATQRKPAVRTTGNPSRATESSNGRRAPAARTRRETRGRGGGRRGGRPIYRHPAVIPLLALLTCLAFVVAAATGTFRVKNVEVVGTGLPAAQIVSTAGLEDRNIFRVRSDSVIGTLTAVRSVAVDRVDTEFPDTVVIHARLRPRFAAWQRGPALLIVDPNGRVVDQVKSTTLPIIVGPADGDTLGPGVVQAVRYAQGALKGVAFGAVSRYEFAPKTGLTLVGANGWRAIMGTGSPATLDLRIATLAATLRKDPNVARISLVDLRNRTGFVRPRP